MGTIVIEFPSERTIDHSDEIAVRLVNFFCQSGQILM
jgi:hypothetical protein